jgi:hypothetical protein
MSADQGAGPWRLLIDGSQSGPYTHQEVADQLASGLITPQTWARSSSMASWLPIGAIPIFNAAESGHSNAIAAAAVPPLSVPPSPIASIRSEPIPTKWLFFWTYIRLPLGILSHLGSWRFVREAATLDRLDYGVFGAVLGLLFPLLIILHIAVIVGLARRRLWGWKLNWIILTVESALIPWFYFETTFLGLVFALAWFAANFDYFRKRRYLFV